MDPRGLFLVAAGLFAAAGGIFNWEWFMNHRKARFMCTILTRTGARIFYIALGAVLAVLGLAITLGFIQ